MMIKVISPHDDLLEDILKIVPLKRYGRPRDLIVFLQRERPEDDDVRVPKNYLASELTEELLPHRIPHYLPNF
jgi:hypothetical protein